MAVLVLDQFTASNGTALAGRAPSPTNTPGNVWVADRGVVDIQSNRASVVSLGAPPSDWMAYSVDAGIADVVVTASLDLTGTTDGGVIVRLTNYTNFWICYARTTGTDLIAIYEVNAGGFTERASQNTSISLGVHTVAVTASGTSITMTLDAEVSINYASATFNQTATKHGIYTGHTGQPEWDDFQIESLAGKGLPVLEHWHREMVMDR